MNPDPIMLAAECVAAWAIVLLPVFWWRRRRRFPPRAHSRTGAPQSRPDLGEFAVSHQPYESSGVIIAARPETGEQQ